MAGLFQNVAEGLAAGSIYGALALAIVFVFRSTGAVNFAQGEMAMVSTFVAWSLLQLGAPLGLAIAGALAFAFLLGIGIERTVIRWFEGGEPLTLSIATIGVFLVLNSAAGWIWGLDPRPFPSMFPQDSFDVGGVRVTWTSIGTFVTLLAVAGLLFLLFERTRLGLLMRAAADNPQSSRLAGVPVQRMLMLGWGLAAMLGALAGALIAPTVFLGPQMMGSVIIYSLAAAALGGLSSPVGALLGGWIIGVAESVISDRVQFIGADLKILVPLFIIFAVLLLRPAGLLGTRETVRV
jgi:branched-chain amino acid transport system permease protein